MSQLYNMVRVTLILYKYIAQVYHALKTTTSHAWVHIILQVPLL